MGLGKTIETLALVHANPHMGEGCKTTLVVCPMSLLSQWEDECKRSTTDTIRVQTYYTAGRNIRHALSTPPDVLITTYGTLQSEHAQSKRALGGPTLFDVEFHRVILDEAHIIKSPSTAIAQACYKLQSRHRWALTGTPIQNKLDDLFSLVHFLRREPWNSNSVWNRLITLPFQRKDPKALQTVQRVMEPIVLRRTKESRDLNGVPLLQLPPKAIQVVYLDFSRQEREIYDMLHKYSKSTFSTLCAAGSVMSNWAHILSLLLRLRQACNHPMLVTSMFNKERAVGQPVELEVLMERFKDTTYAKSVIQGLHDDTVKECPVCLEEMLSMVVLPCAHVTCRDCMHEFLDKREEQGLDGECPVCRVGLDISQLALVTPPSPSTPTANVTGSTKMNALVQAIRNHPPNTKCVVFSQFTSMLNLIQRALDHASISHTRLDGDLSHKDRQIVLTTFKSTTVNVLLISLRAGGVGLNLTHASRVYMMDPWWNWSIEAQAIDRVHRFGQLHAVQVIRFIMRDSVEERMLHIQDRKRVLTGSALRDKDELERVEELNMLFQ
jgi:DNA repair protein RAD5